MLNRKVQIRWYVLCSVQNIMECCLVNESYEIVIVSNYYKIHYIGGALDCGVRNVLVVLWTCSEWIVLLWESQVQAEEICSGSECKLNELKSHWLVRYDLKKHKYPKVWSTFLFQASLSISPSVSSLKPIISLRAKSLHNTWNAPIALQLTKGV